MMEDKIKMIENEVGKMNTIVDDKVERIKYLFNSYVDKTYNVNVESLFVDVDGDSIYVDVTVKVNDRVVNVCQTFDVDTDVDVIMTIVLSKCLKLLI